MSIILIADSGSTKTEWRAVKEGVRSKVICIIGAESFLCDSREDVRTLRKEMPEMEGLSVDRIWFYCTGVSNAAKAEMVRKALSDFFGSGELVIGSDLLGAARSLCMNEPRDSMHYRDRIKLMLL